MGGKKENVYDVYIAYRHGVDKKNSEKIKPVYNKLNGLGYKVFFDNEDKDNKTNFDQNLSILENARVVLVFLDSSVNSLKEGDGFYKELERIYHRDNNREDVLVYRYNGYESGGTYPLSDLKKYTYLDESSELTRSADLVVRDVENMLHRYWPMTFKEYNDEINKESKKYNEKYKKWGKTKKLLILLLGISILFVILFWLFAHTQKIIADTNKKNLSDVITAYEKNEKKILFAGGSTVKNCIDSLMYASFIDDYPNSLFVNMGSEAAWRLLVEDYLIEPKNRNYYPVILSAEKLDTERLKKETGFNDKSSVIKYDSERQIKEIAIGKANLVVELSSCDEFGEYKNKKTISIESLKRLIERTGDSISLYRTSLSSGTLARYKELLLQDKDSAKINEIIIDSASTFAPKGIRGSKNVILTNQYYTTDDVNSIKLNVENNNDTCDITLYVYFVEIRSPEGFEKPKPVANFITKLIKKIGANKCPINKIPLH